jgi:hypothetical protein
MSLSAMERGVDVLASASGTVRGVRNDMRDVIYTPELADEINGRDCGNGVAIVHEGGWETQYCHIKEGSVVVQSGYLVAAGDVLGQVGLSGRTQFPHVHITLRRQGQVVDPFILDGRISCDEPGTSSLWATSPDTPAGGRLSIDFSYQIPDYDVVIAGEASVEALRPNAPIVLWAFAFGAQPGDVVKIEFAGPDGPLFETEDVLDRTQALFMRAGGLNPPAAGWPKGVYSGVVTHDQGQSTLDQRRLQITLR